MNEVYKFLPARLGESGEGGSRCSMAFMRWGQHGTMMRQAQDLQRGPCSFDIGSFKASYPAEGGLSLRILVARKQGVRSRTQRDTSVSKRTRAMVVEEDPPKNSP